MPASNMIWAPRVTPATWKSSRPDAATMRVLKVIVLVVPLPRSTTSGLPPTVAKFRTGGGALGLAVSLEPLTWISRSVALTVTPSTPTRAMLVARASIA